MEFKFLWYFTMINYIFSVLEVYFALVNVDEKENVSM